MTALLRDLLMRRDTCVLRGAILDPNRARGVRRLLHPDPETGEVPTVGEAARAWLALDLDGLSLPAGADQRDLSGCGVVARAALPHAFHGSACIVAATAGHGFKPGARLRLWFLLARPLAGAECKRWLRSAPVDLSVFGAVQPIYTAAPAFVGMRDPMPARLVTLDGTERVTPPCPAALAPPPAPVVRHLGGNPTPRLAGLIHSVRAAPEGQRHRTLYWAARCAGEMVAAGAIGAQPAAAVLAQAAMDGGGRDWRNAEATARDGIRRGAVGGGQ